MRYWTIGVVLVVASVGRGAGPEFETRVVAWPTSSPSLNFFSAFAIEGDIAVWQDNFLVDDGMGGFEHVNALRAKDLTTGQMFDVGSGDGFSQPDVSGKVVVWADYRSGEADIYAWDLVARQEIVVCTAAGNQYAPRISGDVVIWDDRRGGTKAIRGYNLATGQDLVVPTPPGAAPQLAEIRGNTVVWTDWRNGDPDDGTRGNADIYAYDLSTGRETAICTDSAKQTMPRVSGDIVVWVDLRNDNADIYAHDMSTGREFPITTALREQWRPVIGDTFVAWEDDRDGMGTLYAYDLATGREYQVPDSDWSFLLDMDDDTLLWTEYGVMPGPLLATTVPEPATLSLLALGGLAFIRRRRK